MYGQVDIGFLPDVFVNQPPTAPGTPTAPSPNNGTFTVTWTASTDAKGIPISNYHVQRSSDNGITFADIGSTNVTTFSQSTLAAGTYLYRVRAFDTANTASNYSGHSSVIEVTAPTPVPSRMISPAPGSALASSTVTFRWDAGIGVVRNYMAVGTTPPPPDGDPSSDIYFLDPMIGNSFTIPNIPLTGQPVYVRLYSSLYDVKTYTSWCHDYVYLTHTTPPTAPGTPTAPSPNTGPFTVT